MAKDPSPRADALRAQREARYGHLQAKAEDIKLTPYEGNPVPAKMGRPLEPKATRKLIPYAGKESGKAIAPKQTVEGVKAPHNPRKRVQRKRRTELPPEGAET